LLGNSKAARLKQRRNETVARRAPRSAMAGARRSRVLRRRRAKAARVAVSRMPRGAIYRARELGPWRAGLGARGGVPRPDSGSSPRRPREGDAPDWWGPPGGDREREEALSWAGENG